VSLRIQSSSGSRPPSTRRGGVTSSGHYRSGRVTAPAGPGIKSLRGCRPPTTRTHGIRYFHGCYSLGDDQLWGITRLRKGGDHTLAALKSIRAARPDGAPIYVILDKLSANETPPIRGWANKHKVKLCFTPTNASWANPRRNSDRCAPSSSAALTTRTTPCWPAGCRPTWPGVTPTLAIPTSGPLSAANAPASAANASNAGDDHGPKPPDSDTVNVHGQRTRLEDVGLGRAVHAPHRHMTSGRSESVLPNPAPTDLRYGRPPLTALSGAAVQRMAADGSMTRARPSSSFAKSCHMSA
jgi:hypothetical protein